MSFIRHVMTAVCLTGAFVSLASLGVAAAHGNSGWILYHAALAALNTMWAFFELAGLLRTGRGRREAASTPPGQRGTRPMTEPTPEQRIGEVAGCEGDS